MVRFTLKQCTYFLAVVEHGGIAQAARALNISQPAISQALDKLENLYGLTLLKRYHAKGAELTAEGRAFVTLAADLVENAERVETKSKAIAAGQAGKVRFGCFHTIAPFFLAGLIRRSAEIHPGLEIEPFELFQDEIVSGLMRGALDAAVTYHMGLDEHELDWEPVAALTPHVLLSSGHRLASRRAMPLSKLASEPFVFFDGPASRDYFQDVLTGQGLDPPVAYMARSMESVRSAVASGLGFSLSVMKPKHGRTYDGRSVVSVAITDKIEPIEIVLAYARGNRPEGALRNLAGLCAVQIETAIDGADC